MAEAQVLSPAEIEEEHSEESQSPYFKVWLALMGMTVVEFLCAIFLRDWFFLLLAVLFVWLVIQAVTMGWWFMHLKFEGAWAKWLILVAVIMSTIVVLALVPDIAYRSADGGTDLSAKVSAAASD
jgi:cytochrome c oxidase subunit IV